MSNKFNKDIAAYNSRGTGTHMPLRHVFELKMSHPSHHTVHPIDGLGAKCRAKVDGSIRKKIKEIGNNGVRNIYEAKRHIKEFLNNLDASGEWKDDIFARQWNPTNQDYQNILTGAKAEKRKAPFDQGNLIEQCKEWFKQGDNYFMRSNTNGQSFVFITQTAWQRRILSLYGKEVVLMDATYKTSKYELPLFFICVQANVRYLTVGAFIVENEDTVTIKEALQIFKSWNPDFQPKYFMTDYSRAEMNAIEELFEDSTVVLCDFHREYAWLRYVNRIANGLFEKKDDVLQLLRNIAYSQTEEGYEKAVDLLKISHVWKENKSFQKYYTNQWEVVYKKWVHCFRDPSLAVHTNNGIESQNKTIKKTFLRDYHGCSLSELVDVIVNNFFVELYRSYCMENIYCTSGYSRYDNSIPPFLRNRPKDFVDQVMKALHSSKNIQLDKITKTSATEFIVPSEENPSTFYKVFLGNTNDLPFCSCYRWIRSKIPCKHMMAVLMNTEGSGWDSLSFRYRSNPLFVLDSKIVDGRYCIHEINNDAQDAPSQVPQPQSYDTNELTDIKFKAYDYNINENMTTNTLPKRKTKSPTDKSRDKALTLCKSMISALYQIEDKTIIDWSIEMFEEILQKQRQNIKTISKAPPPAPTTVLPEPTSTKPTPSPQLAPQPICKSSFTATSNAPKVQPPPASTALEPKYSTRPPSTSLKRPKKANIKTETLPLLKKKDPLKGRVGAYADMIRRARNISVILDDDDENDFLPIKKTKKNNKVKKNFGGIVLSDGDWSDLKQSKWLNDKHINAAQNLLKEKHPDMGGLHDIFLPKPVVNKDQKKHLQIHNAGKSHWIVSALFNKCIMVYDSLHTSLTEDIKEVLRQMFVNFKNPDGKLEISLIRNQLQEGFDDCGLFAISTATSLCLKGKVISNHQL